MNHLVSYQKYIKKFSYHNLPHIHYSLNKNIYKYFIIIPAYNEYPTILKTLDSINSQPISYLKDTLVIIIINNSKNDHKHVIKNNSYLYNILKIKKYNYELITLDYFSQYNAIDQKNFGVGTARKIGMDFALNYAQESSLFFSLDADTLLDKQYLLTIVDSYKKNNFHVFTINFKHQKSNDKIINKGIEIYENALYYMANKIKESKSPYGYVSMGSAMGCTVKAYIAIGGMPQRNAAEDFYFLQSLAKYTSIYTIQKILVYPSSRSEQRVHLGTGYRMKEFQQNYGFKNLFFTESSYLVIKDFIEIIEKHYKKPYAILYKKLNQYFDNNVCNFLTIHSLNNIWNKINDNAKTKRQFMIFFHQWFDALKIMQLLKKLNMRND